MKSKISKRLGHIFLALWIPIVVVILSMQMATHLLTMPSPPSDELQRLADDASQLREGQWKAIHVVYSQCSCANSLVGQLLERGPEKGFQETIAFVGEDHRLDDLRRRGFSIYQTTTEALANTYQVESAPLLIVFDSQRELRYFGGYYETNYEWLAQDRSIMTTLSSGGEVQALPIYGCPMSDRLREMFDPTGYEGWVQRLTQG